MAKSILKNTKAVAAKSKPAKPITVVPPPVVKAKDTFLRATPELTAKHLITAVKALGHETAGAYDIKAISDDGPGYGSRLRVLKALRGGDRVVVKDAEPANLRRELHTAIGAKNAGDFALKCAALEAASKKSVTAMAKQVADSKKRDAALKNAVVRAGKPVFDGKPILDAPKKLNKKEEAADQAKFKAELAAKVAKAEREAAAMPMAQPRADAAIVEHDLSAVCLLEDPSNGIVLLRLEFPNSQGAICVYNNGSRVAAGVVATETLKILHVKACEDIAADVRLFLHPLSSSVVVTPVAERHLTALLKRIEENIMAGKKKIAEAEAKAPKFAAPKGAPVKGTAEAKVKKAKDGTLAPERKSSLFRLLNDTKSTWSAFTTQKKLIVDAFVKLGAVGKTSTGVTRAALVAALPQVPDKNISFYLSKWNPAGIVEKLPAA